LDAFNRFNTKATPPWSVNGKLAIQVFSGSVADSERYDSQFTVDDQL